MICGDFNAILGAHENRGACLSGYSSCQNFLDMLYDSGLTKLSYTRVNLTWRG